MIKDNLLKDRLNAVRVGNPIPTVQKEIVNISSNQTIDNSSKLSKETVINKQFFKLELYKTFQVLVVSILYGYGISSIFEKEWTFLGLFGVGLIFNHILSNILKLILKLSKTS